MSTKNVETHLDLVFRSGMSAKSDFIGASDAGVPIGVVVDKLTGHQVVFSLPRYLDNGGKVFVDSGAFTAFITGGEISWPDVIKRYTQILNCTFNPGNLFLVAPDKIGDQEETIKLIKKWKQNLLELISGGANLIVPIQCGAMPAQTMIKQIAATLETTNWIAGIPSNRAAMSIEECQSLRHHSFHILGRVQKNDDQDARISALRQNNKGAIVTADANWIRSRISKVSSSASKERLMREGMNLSETFSMRHPRSTAITALIATDTWGRN